MDVLALVDAAEALGFAASIVETIADRFMEVPSVGWSDVHAAGIAGRDIARLRRHIEGQVCLLGSLHGIVLEWNESVSHGDVNAVKRAVVWVVLTPGCGISFSAVLRASRGDTTACSKCALVSWLSLNVVARLHRSPLLCRVCTRIATLRQGWQPR